MTQVSLTDLQHYLTMCPARYWREPLTGDQILAALADSVSQPVPSDVQHLLGQSPRGWLLVLLISWLLQHPSLVAPSEAFWIFCRTELLALAQVVPDTQWWHNPERQEELLRRILKSLGMMVLGETAIQSQEQLQELDSLYNQALLNEIFSRYQRRQAVKAALKRRLETEPI